MSLPRLWVLAFVGFGLTIGAWSLAAPYNGSPDEAAHTLRAYQVMSGDIAPAPAPVAGGTGAYQWGPKNLHSANCVNLQPAACTADVHGAQTLVRIGNPAGRYNPFYYAIVGLPIKIWPTMKGIVLARLISAAMGAALLAAALVSIVRYSRHRLMLGALLFGVTPMAVSLAGAVNPNGLEIAAGIAFFASAIPLLLGGARERPPTWLVCVTVVSAVILVTVRSGGPIWLALGGLALLLPLRLRTVRELLRPVSLRWGFLVVAVAGLASGLWILIMGASELSGQAHKVGVGQIMFLEFLHWPDITQQMVGYLGLLDTRMWGPVYQLWEYPAGALLLVALLVGTGLDRARLLVVTAGTVAVAIVTEANALRQGVGLITQGRYLLPTLSGGLLLAAWVIERRGAVTAARARLVTRFAVVLTLPIQLHALQMTMTRYQRGIVPMAPWPSVRDFNPFTGGWHPRVGSLVPVTSAVFGLAVLGVLCWRLAAGSVQPTTDRAAVAPAERADSRGRDDLAGQGDAAWASGRLSVPPARSTAGPTEGRPRAD